MLLLNWKCVRNVVVVSSGGPVSPGKINGPLGGTGLQEDKEAVPQPRELTGRTRPGRGAPNT